MYCRFFFLHIIFIFLIFFSLRTSETSYLNEAFSFYSAIRQRSYYHQVNKEDRWKEAAVKWTVMSKVDTFLLFNMFLKFLWSNILMSKSKDFKISVWYGFQFINFAPCPLHRPELVVKKLRYYARFIVVCLLLNKMDLVKVLVKVSHGHQTKRISYTFLVHGSL